MFSITRVTSSNIDHVLTQVGPMTRFLLSAAFSLGYTVDSIDDLHICRISKKGKSVLIKGACLPLNNFIAAEIANNKYITHALFELSNIPTPHSVLIKRSQISQQAEQLAHISFPVVLKPAKDTVKGHGVVTNIATKAQLDRYIKSAFKKYGSLLIEEYYSGLQDYRVLVLDNKIIGVLKRIPAYVVGDGIQTIQQLIRTKNTLRKQSTTITMGTIHVDDELTNTLRQKKLTLKSIPKRGEHVQVKNVCNFGSGGEVEDVTDQICKENKQLAIQAAKVLDLRFVGLDFLCTDIRKPVIKTTGVILEANEEPDFVMHYYPENGQKRKIAEKIIEALFI